MKVVMTVGEPKRHATPGTITRDSDGSYRYTCPCGCGNVFYAKGYEERGSLERGDLSLWPSLNHEPSGRCQYHAWLADGAFDVQPAPRSPWRL